MLTPRCNPLSRHTEALSYEPLAGFMLSAVIGQNVSARLLVDESAIDSERISRFDSHSRSQLIAFVTRDGSIFMLQYALHGSYHQARMFHGMCELLKLFTDPVLRTKAFGSHEVSFLPDAPIPQELRAYYYALYSDRTTPIGLCRLRSTLKQINFSSHLHTCTQRPMPICIDVCLRSNFPAPLKNSTQIALKELQGMLHVGQSRSVPFHINSVQRNSKITIEILEDIMNEQTQSLPLDIYLGQVELTLDDAVRLRPGMVLEFNLSEALQVSLKVAGATWGRGVLRLGEDGAYITMENCFYDHTGRSPAENLSAIGNF